MGITTKWCNWNLFNKYEFILVVKARQFHANSMIAEGYTKSCQMFKTERFVKIVYDFAKRSAFVFYVWQGSEYTSEHGIAYIIYLMPFLLLLQMITPGKITLLNSVEWFLIFFWKLCNIRLIFEFLYSCIDRVFLEWVC